MHQTYRFHCEVCSYTTNHKNDYNKHLSTKKHAMRLDNKTLPDADVQINATQS